MKTQVAQIHRHKCTTDTTYAGQLIHTVLMTG